MSNPCHFFFQNKNETLNHNINKPHLMKKSQYQQYFLCFLIYILVPYAFRPPDHVILHVGTNDLSSEKCSMEIAESIANLACRLKNESMSSAFQQLF